MDGSVVIGSRRSPRIPRPNESFKRLAFGAKSRLLPEKGFLNRTDCELKIRSTVTYIASFLRLNLDYTDKGAAGVWMSRSDSKR